MSAPLQKSRWPSGPKQCATANLPAFETPGALDDFLKKNSPSCKVIRKYQCAHCGHWHADTIAPDPAGGSSGTGRGSKFATHEEWQKFVKAKTPADLIEE